VRVKEERGEIGEGRREEGKKREREGGREGGRKEEELRISEVPFSNLHANFVTLTAGLPLGSVKAGK